MKRFVLLVLALCAPAFGQAVEGAEKSERMALMAYYVPRSFFGLIGVIQPAGPEAITMCNLTDGWLLARVEWRTAAGRELTDERFLQAGKCELRELADDELPVFLRPLWRALGPWTELR